MYSGIALSKKSLFESEDCDSLVDNHIDYENPRPIKNSAPVNSMGIIDYETF